MILKRLYTLIVLLCPTLMLSAQNDSLSSSSQIDTIATESYRSLHLDPLFSIQSANAKGLKFSLISNNVGGKMYGVQLSGISNLSHEMTGVQIAPFSNISSSHIHGIQLGGVSNIAMGVNHGTQAALITNVCANQMHGLQLGAYNYADTLQGLQLGIFNASISEPKGYQIGIINYSRDTLNRHSYGLITIKPNTTLRTVLLGGSSTYLSGAIEVCNGKNYSLLGLGAFNRDFSHFSGTLFYRLGRRYPLGKSRWHLGGDIGFYHMEGFENNDDENPDRLYSIQPHLTADYRLGDKFSLMASLGYEVTRYYKGGKFRNGIVGELGVAYHLRPQRDMQHNVLSPQNKNDIGTLASENPYNRKYPWVAAAQAAGINVFVHCFDRWVLKEDFAQTTWKSIGDNLSNGFVWDNDNFSTNQFMHPYHGGLYFTSARSNGMNFWQSYPFALGGSLMWEFFGENTPPSINDVFSTSIGGAAIGETTYRVSSLVLDDSSTGWERVGRELVGLVVSPMRGLARMLHGDMFRRRSHGARYHDFQRIPVNLDITTGVRYLGDHGSFFRGATGQYIETHFRYGDAMSDENKPYDFFDANMTMNLWSNQPLVSDLHLLGLLWGRDMMERKNLGIKVGIFQHFNFYSSESVIENDEHSPYLADDAAKGNAPFRVSETAAIGPGAILRFNKAGNLSFLEQRIFLNAILMGGSQSDYYRILWRDYNLGSGYSAKVNTIMKFSRYAQVELKSEFYHFFTWEGYSESAKEIMASYKDEKELEYINAQGDQGNAKLFIFAPHFQLNLNRHLLLDIDGAYYYRHTSYHENPSVRRRTTELRLGLTYDF